jgi:diguanylate cyclase (GGDEF)-like protein
VSTRRRLRWVLVAAIIVAAIGWFDYETGPEIGLSLLYLIPVALSGWFGGVTAAVIVGCFAGGSWLAADVAWRESDTAIAISLWNAFTRFVIYVSEGVFIALLHRDREKLKQLAARESLLARTDSNTGLPNARAFLERAERELQRGASLCVLYVDLDNFKTFNDRLGHAAGDDILDEVARILRETIGDDGIAARIGGDEFALLLGCGDQDTARRIGDGIVSRIREVGRAFPDIGFGATVGVVFCPSPPDNAEELLRVADAAMYRGKEEGKGQVVFENLGQNV